jgi:hypothetical protein
MPIYEYEYINPDGTGGEHFEWLQRMSDEPLTTHPESGLPCRRIIGVPNAPKTWTDQQGKAATSDSNLERLGFTKYVRGDSGKYEKRFGKGPDSVRKPPSDG